jgi:glycosyltransferase involved in cell wall biosynthesis
MPNGSAAVLDTQPERGTLARPAGRAARHLPPLTVLSAGPSSESDGIHAYSGLLVESLRADLEIDASWRNPRETLADLRHARRFGNSHPPAFVLQYNPFNYGRWGFAPWLPLKLWRLKRVNGARIALMVHERYYPIRDWRSALMGGWQRAQYYALHLLADVVFVSIASWAAILRDFRPRRPVHHLPVGSNLPDMRGARASQRARLGASDETLVLAAFGTNHPARLMDYVVEAVDRIAALGASTILLNLGSGAPTIEVNPAVRVITPGHLDEDELARYLAAADLCLNPLRDGVSTRRGTVMAALQHGLSIVATDGHNTDPVLRHATDALRLTPVGDRDGFVRAACELATDAAARADRGARARELYESEFNWDVISRRLVTELF